MVNTVCVLSSNFPIVHFGCDFCEFFDVVSAFLSYCLPFAKIELGTIGEKKKRERDVWFFFFFSDNL